MQRIQPQVLKTLYKGRRYDTKLRELTELCGKAYQKAIDKLNKIQTHYSRPSIVLELEDEENGYAGALNPLWAQPCVPSHLESLIRTFVFLAYIRP